MSRPGGGGKFDPDGHALPFPGNTFLCHLDRGSDAYRTVCTLLDALQALPTARYFTFLPRESLHMTVFCGVSGSPLGSDGWPLDVSRDASLTDVTEIFTRRLDGVTLPERFDVRAVRLDTGRAIAFAPADEASRSRLQLTRDSLAQVTGLHRADQHSYEFHLSLGYLARFMPPDVAEEHVDAVDDIFGAVARHLTLVPFGPIEFCTFENMLAFTPRTIVGARGPVHL